MALLVHIFTSYHQSHQHFVVQAHFSAGAAITSILLSPITCGFISIMKLMIREEAHVGVGLTEQQEAAVLEAS